jgi:hypothetical protein
MLETLAGRLKWERNGDGIRVELPAPLDRPHVLWAIVQSLSWLFFVYLIVSFENLISDGFHKNLIYWWFFPTFAPLYVALWIWKLLERRTILTLTPGEMTLNRGIRETSRNTRVFANGRLHNLCYCASRNAPTAEREEVKNCLLLDVEYRTISIMSGITEEEATILIGKMMEVYKFPKSPEINTAAPVQAN